MNYALRGVSGNDNHERLNLAYSVADPWNMASDLERFRFERTNSIIRRHMPDCQSILEIGCGEGHQTEYLREVCPKICGIDVSEKAIERARRRVPDAEFAVGDIFGLSPNHEPSSFDLVVACEVLYYISDIGRTIAEMNRLGRACLVTIFAPAIRRVGPHLEAQPDLVKDWFGTQGAEWVAGFWRPERVGEQEVNAP